MARILVIEDERKIGNSLRKVLTAAGHVVSLVQNGKGGLKRFIRSQAELVIIDLHKARRRGIETIIEIRRLSPHIAIIAMSGIDQGDPVLLTAKLFGAKATIKKSFSPAQLLRTVDSTLRTQTSVQV